MKPFILAILLLTLASSVAWNIPNAVASVPTSLESSTLNRSAFNYLVSTLWNSRVGAFGASPVTEPYNFWSDDQAKIANLLALDPTGNYVNQTFTQWGTALVNYLSGMTLTNTGYVLRRQVNPINPIMFSSNPATIMAGNNIWDFRGNLNSATAFNNKIVYDPQGQTVAYIQGHVLNYNGTDHDLSNALPPTGTSVTQRATYIQLRQIWAESDFTLYIDYFIQANVPYLLVKYTLKANKLLSGPPKFTVPLDQLDFLGETLYANGPHLGYAWFWASGFPDQRANDAAQGSAQHLLGDSLHPVSEWNQSWYMVHIHDKFDGTANSFAIIADWGGNKTGLVAVDATTGGTALPSPRLANTFHYLKQYYQLSASLAAGQTASFEVKYYFLAAHDWYDLSAVYTELMGRNLANLDPSSTYQYGVIVYGLAKLYNAGISNAYLLARRIENYWFNTFTQTAFNPGVGEGLNGTYGQSIGFMIKADVLLAKTGAASAQSTFAAHTITLMNELLNMQDTRATDQNYGLVRERRYYNATKQTYYFGNSYVDFQATAISAISDYLAYKGSNSTITSRLSLLTNHMFLTVSPAAYGIVFYNTTSQQESILPVAAGHLATWLNTSTNVIDADTATYKNGLLLDAFTRLNSIGYSNSTFTLREISFVWKNSALTPSVVAYVDSTRKESNTETLPWAVWGWREWVDAMLSATGQYAAIVYLTPYSNFIRLMNITWNPVSSTFYDLKYAVNAGNSITSIVLSDRSPTGVRGIFQTTQLTSSWLWTLSNQTISATMAATSYYSAITYEITWLGQWQHSPAMGTTITQSLGPASLEQLTL